MRVGSLVRIKSNEHLGLFVVMAFNRDRRWTKLVSLRDTEEHYELLRSLEVVNAKR